MMLIIILGLVLSILLSGASLPQPPMPIPDASISILTPSDGSTVITPLHLKAALICQPDATLRIELVGHDQTLLYRKLIRPACQAGETILLNESIFFDANLKARPARISIQLEDANQVHLAVASSALTLALMGENLISATDHQADFIITSPANQGYITGGEFQLSGWMRPSGTTPIILELISESGELLASRQLSIPESYAGDYFYIEASIPYQVDRIRDVFLIVRQMGERLPGDITLERF